jgi:hypothetical protein
MSSWDASSRPTWDPQGGEGENTQSFPVGQNQPGFPVGQDQPGFGVPDSWNSSQEPPEGGGFPGSASPGTPPDIFLEDYDSNDFEPSDFAPNGFGSNGAGRHAASPQDPAPWDRFQGSGPQGSVRPGTGPQGTGPQGTGPQGTGPQGTGPQGTGHRGNSHRDNGHRGRAQQDPLQRDPAPWDRGQQDYLPQGYRAPERPQRPQRPDRPERLDRPDPGERGYADPMAYRDSEQAARVDPALRDFFAPQPARPDSPRQGAGQQRYGSSGHGGQGRDPWGPPPDDREPYREARDSRDSRGTRPPGSRAGHRQEAPPRRSGLTALVAVAVVVVIGIGVGAYLLMHHGNSAPQSTNGPTTTPTSSPTATRSAAPPPKPAGYTLTTPVTAGGYSALSKIPAAIVNTASTTEAAIGGPALSNGGGKIAGKGVAAAYQLSSGQVMSFIGYEGTFNPAKVLSNLASLGQGGKQYAAGPHGGDLACATAPGTRSGTVCIWATKTTLAVTEFFASNDSPEVVTDQPRAAADTLKLRNSVEVPK